MRARKIGGKPGEPRTSPLATTGYAAGASPARGARPAAALPASDDGDHATVSVKKSALADVRRGAAGVPKLHDDDEDGANDETKALPAEMLVPRPNAHVVVGRDEIGGDDATLAVGSEPHLSSNIGAALAESLQQRPSGPGGSVEPQDSKFPVTHGFAQPQHAQPQHAPPHLGPMQPGMHQPAPMQQPPMMGMQPHTPHLQQPWGAGASGRAPAAHQPQQPFGAPMHAQVGMQAPGMSSHGARSGQTSSGVPGAGPEWAPQGQQAGLGGRWRISGREILLLIVGFICISIFVTGIVLFASTR